MSSEWQDNNVIMRTLTPGVNLAGKVTDATGVTSMLKSAGATADQVQNLASRHVIDPLLGDVAKAALDKALEHLKDARDALKPNFLDHPGGHRIHEIRYSYVSPSGRSTDPGTRPLRMFNLRTGNLEETWGKPKKYAILSHGWNGEEIEISDFKDARKKFLKGRMPPAFSAEGLELAPDTRLPPDVDLILRYYDAEVTRLRIARAGDATRPLTKLENTAIQKRASAHKISKSFQRARELFSRELKVGIAELDEYMKSKGDLFLWNDTCCIDKLVLNEGANSIASMGEWYTNAEFCIVHLCHNPLHFNPPQDKHSWTAAFHSDAKEPLTITRGANYEWFEDLTRPGATPYWAKRGWTLQELCLSTRAFYFNNKWELLAFRSKSGDDAGRERQIIASMSRVPQSEVCRGRNYSAVSAFELLGFASQRDCTIPVDRVYSTMGMLGVKFVTFNPEGPCMALSRLLDHVVGLTRDVSVFNWSGVDSGSTIPGRSLYPASLEPFSKHSRTDDINNAARVHYLQMRSLRELNSSEAIKELMELGSSKGDMFNPAPSAGKAPQKRHLIDWALDRFAWFVSDSKVKYSSLPVDTINKILDAISDMRIEQDFSYEYVLFRRLLRFIQKDNRRSDDQGKAIKKLEGSVKQPLDTDPSDPPPPYPQPPPPPAPERPAPRQVEEPATPPSQSTSSFGIRKLGFGKTKGKAPAPEAPVAEKPKSIFSSSQTRLSSLLSRDDKAPEEGKPNTSSQGGGGEEQEKTPVKHREWSWYTMVDNIVDYITPSSRRSSHTNDPYTQHRLFYIGKILDALILHSLKGSPDVEFEADFDFEQERLEARYLPQIIANRTLCFVIGSKNPTNVPDVLNMLQVLTYIGHTRFDELSPSHIGDLRELLNRTRFRVCPSYAEIQKIHENHESPLCQDLDPKGLLFDNDHDDDDESEARKDGLPGPMISPNPLIVTSSGIEGLFDIQRAVVDILSAAPVEPDEAGTSISSTGSYEYDAGTYARLTDTRLYRSLQAKIADGRGDVRYTGKCLISTGLSQITVGFSCTADLLKKQLDLRDLIRQTELKNHFEGNRNVQDMLRFVKERDIELVVGEWVLARFSGVPGAHWFLCLLELGDTHPYYGWRIPTDLIDFSLSTYEPPLVELWKRYMKEKKELQCKWIGKRLQQRKVAQMKEDTKRKQDDSDVKLFDLGVERSWDVVTGRSTVLGAVTDGVYKVGKMVEADVTHLMVKKEQYDLKLEEHQARVDLRSKALMAAGVDKDLHAAVLSLDDNSVLPTMYFPSMRVHMF